MGQRLEDEEVPELVPPMRFLALKQRLLEATETDRYTMWAKWFLGDRRTRNTSPSSGVTASSHVDRLIEENSQSTLRQALHLSPENAVATARLARQVLAQNSKKNPRKLQEAEYLAGLAH